MKNINWKLNLSLLFYTFGFSIGYSLFVIGNNLINVDVTSKETSYKFNLLEGLEYLFFKSVLILSSLMITAYYIKFLMFLGNLN